MEHFVNFENNFNEEIQLFLQAYKSGKLSSDETSEYLDELIAHPQSNIE